MRSICASLLSLALAATTSPAAAQTDPRLVDAVRAAQEGRGDSARVTVQRLLEATPPTDTLYPQIVYTQAMVASSAADMRRDLQRVAIEYGSSSWADDALLRLVQMDYATRNFDGAARNLERLRLDFPATPLFPQAAYWAGRTYFDLNYKPAACRWLGDGIARAQGNLEVQNQLGYLHQRCTPADTAVAAQQAGRTDSAGGQAGAGGTPRDTARAAGDTTPAPVARDTAARAAVDSAPVDRQTRFRVQVAAVKTAAAADNAANRVEKIGVSTVIVRERGFYKVRAGAYATRTEARAAAAEIKAKLGGSPFVVAEP
ncbi:MAG: tetratricopeptide repeat protein [Gemmatimonadales bacterium]